MTLYELTEEYLKLLDTKKAIDESKVETDIKTTLFSFYIKPAEDVLVVDNESEIPERFFVAQEPKLNKKDLNKWAKNNPDKVAAFGHYEPVNSLIIK